MRAAKVAQQPAREQRTPEERQAERDAERRRKAQVRSAHRTRARAKAKAKRRGRGRGAAAPRGASSISAGRRRGRGSSSPTVRARRSSCGSTSPGAIRSYEKIVRTSTTLHAHDEREDAHIGDTVVVRESRPLSRTKRWRLVEVLERAK